MSKLPSFRMSWVWLVIFSLSSIIALAGCSPGNLESQTKDEFRTPSPADIARAKGSYPGGAAKK